MGKRKSLDILSGIGNELQGSRRSQFTRRQSNPQLSGGKRIEREGKHIGIMVVQNQFGQDADAQITGHHGNDRIIILGRILNIRMNIMDFQSVMDVDPYPAQR